MWKIVRYKLVASPAILIACREHAPWSSVLARHKGCGERMLFFHFRPVFTESMSERSEVPVTSSSDGLARL